MNILVACEFSGRVRDAFLRKGHRAVSCDFLPCESKYPGEHYQGNVMDILHKKWNRLIAFPDCTYRANSGVRWIINNLQRQEELRKADEFFNLLLDSDIPEICIENPIPHHYSKVRKYDQIIQPWMFGDNESKSTCLWLKGLPKLIPAIRVKPNNIKHSIHKMAPSHNRSHLRSITFPGIANAMSNQWG